MWKGKGDLLPWLVAALVAIVSAKLVPGSWYIIFGGIAGSLAGAIAEGMKRRADSVLKSLAAILGMALVTFAIKAGGLLLANRLPREGFAAAWLRHIPGAVLASLVAPAILTGGAAEAIAAAATALVYMLTRNLLAAMAAGVLGVFLVRMALGA